MCADPHDRHFPCLKRPPAQGGYAALLLLTLVSLSALVLIAGRPLQLPSHAAATWFSPVTADALKQAKEALLAYAATYPEQYGHGDETYGYLPLPDMGGELDNLNKGKEGWAATGFSGNGKNITLIGRLPWRTLKLPPLKDEYGECLWYALSGSYKNNPKGDTMNWDTPGYLEPKTSDGRYSVFGLTADQRAVAVIFSAGPPLPGQDRTHAQVQNAASKDNVTECHGNYDVRNYLDPYVVEGRTGGHSNWFADSIHHAIDGNAAAVKALLAGPQAFSGDGALLNDRSVTITASEIFNLVKQRGSRFESHLQAIIQATSVCVPSAGSVLRSGKASAFCSGGMTPDPASAKWLDHFFYISCPAAVACLSINGTPCSAALIFGGERNDNQSRGSDSERADPANYLEAPNLATYLGGSGGSLSGAGVYRLTASSADVVTCVRTP